MERTSEGTMGQLRRLQYPIFSQLRFSQERKKHNRFIIQCWTGVVRQIKAAKVLEDYSVRRVVMLFGKVLVGIVE